jgi:hypothetical protein
MEARVKIFFAI